MDKGKTPMLPFSFFRSKQQYIYIYVYVYVYAYVYVYVYVHRYIQYVYITCIYFSFNVYIYSRKTELTENGNIILFAENGNGNLFFLVGRR
jgi:hypothetical protein